MDRDTTLKTAAELVARTSKEARWLFYLICLGREMSADYNNTLKDYLASVNVTTSRVDELAHALDIDAIGNHFEKLALILTELHVTDKEARQYHLIRR